MINKITGLRVLIMPMALLLVVLISILFVQPEYSNVRNLQKGLGNSQSQLDDIKTQQSKLSNLLNNLGSLEGKNLVDVALPGKADQEDYLAEIYQRASKSGVILNNISFLDKTQAGNVVLNYECDVVTNASSAASLATSSQNSYIAGGSSASSAISENPICANKLTAEVESTGNWDQILNFLKYATDSNRLATINAINISAGSANGSEMSANGDALKAKIDISIFSKTKSETSNPTTIAALIGSQGIDKNALQNLVGMVYMPYEAQSVSQTGERNIFK